jgi:hypothetical protein
MLQLCPLTSNTPAMNGPTKNQYTSFKIFCDIHYRWSICVNECFRIFWCLHLHIQSVLYTPIPLWLTVSRKKGFSTWCGWNPRHVRLSEVSSVNIARKSFSCTPHRCWNLTTLIGTIVRNHSAKVASSETRNKGVKLPVPRAVNCQYKQCTCMSMSLVIPCYLHFVVMGQPYEFRWSRPDSVSNADR